MRSRAIMLYCNSRRWRGDVRDMSSGFHVESVRADAKLLQVHNRGYHLRFHLPQENGIDRSLDFPLD